MREFFHTMKVSFLLAAILYVILGLVLLLWPGVSAVVFCYAFGGVLPAHDLLMLILTQIGMKTAYEIIALPLTNRLVKWVKRKEHTDVYDTDVSYKPWKVRDI